MKKSTIIDIFTRFSDQNPEPKTELEYVNHYTLLVAVILSAQSTDAGVNKATRALFKKVDTPEKMVNLGLDKLKEHIKTIGLFNSKAKNIIAMSNQLIERHNSTVPDQFEALCKLPGVGIKTANVILNCAFNQPTMAVDTHVFRVSNRMGLVKTTSPEKTGQPLLKAIPDPFKLHAHHWLILHGRYICKARKPLCNECIIRDLCTYKHKTILP